MKGRKAKIAVLIISFLVFLGTTGNIWAVTESYRLTNENTTEFSTTVESVKTADAGKTEQTEIFTKEYKSSLLIVSSVVKNIDEGEISALKKGDRIFFRTNNANSDLPEKSDLFVDIVSLKTESKVIFSLEDYNGFIKKSSVHVITAATVVLLLSLIAAVYCAVSLKRKK